MSLLSVMCFLNHYSLIQDFLRCTPFDENPISEFPFGAGLLLWSPNMLVTNDLIRYQWWHSLFFIYLFIFLLPCRQSKSLVSPCGDSFCMVAFLLLTIVSPCSNCNYIVQLQSAGCALLGCFYQLHRWFVVLSCSISFIFAWSHVARILMVCLLSISDDIACFA